MKKIIKTLVIAYAILTSSVPAVWAQIDFSRLISGAQKAVQAFTLSDEQINAYVHEYIQHSDSTNKVLPETSPYVIRLRSLTQSLTDVEGTPLNFKVYEATEVNAFACADGSVRVYSALMDAMDDNELLGVIGHEIGHVAHRDSRKAFQTALMTSALKDGIASRGGVVAQLTDSQLGQLGEALVNARYSQKQENNADDYGYDFLKKHGKNPAAMAASFKKLKQLEGTTSTGINMVNQLFSSWRRTSGYSSRRSCRPEPAEHACRRAACSPYRQVYRHQRACRSCQCLSACHVARRCQRRIHRHFRR